MDFNPKISAEHFSYLKLKTLLNEVKLLDSVRVSIVPESWDEVFVLRLSQDKQAKLINVYVCINSNLLLLSFWDLWGLISLIPSYSQMLLEAKLAFERCLQLLNNCLPKSKSFLFFGISDFRSFKGYCHQCIVCWLSSAWNLDFISGCLFNMIKTCWKLYSMTASRLLDCVKRKLFTFADTGSCRSIGKVAKCRRLIARLLSKPWLAEPSTSTSTSSVAWRAVTSAAPDRSLARPRVLRQPKTSEEDWRCSSTRQSHVAVASTGCVHSTVRSGHVTQDRLATAIESRGTWKLCLVRIEWNNFVLKTI